MAFPVGRQEYFPRGGQEEISIFLSAFLIKAQPTRARERKRSKRAGFALKTMAELEFLLPLRRFLKTNLAANSTAKYLFFSSFSFWRI